MKMVKSLLLGSAAAFVAVAGAQAADLPVKAKAAEYVKVCAAYGAGFYYIPGTDTCLKIGGYARFDAYVNGTGTFNPMISNQSSIDSSDVGNSYNTRVRGIVQFDARTQTEYGVLRSYVSLGANMDSWSGNNGGSSVEYDKVFIQFAGLTAGYTSSFFGANINYMYTTPYTNSARKVNQLAYTAQFGNGFSATMALEDGRQRAVLSTAPAYWAGDARGGDQVPDFVGVLRLDQAWGFAQLSGAAHESRVALGWDFQDTSTSEWGWAVSGTLMFKLPMLAKGDGFFVTAAYADGAVNYAGMSGSDGSGTLPTQFGRVNGAGTGSAFYRLSDVVSDSFGNYDKTSVWSVTGQFRHYWTPTVRSAVMGGYASVDAPESVFAFDNGFNDFDLWQVGFNTIWSPVKNLDIGAEVLYSKIDGSLPYGYLDSTGAATVFGGSTDLVSGGIRIQRNF